MRLAACMQLWQLDSCHMAAHALARAWGKWVHRPCCDTNRESES